MPRVQEELSADKGLCKHPATCGQQDTGSCSGDSVDEMADWTSSMFEQSPTSSCSSSPKCESSAFGESFRHSLRRWAVEHAIRRRPLTELLRLLKRQEGFSDLPSDARTLLSAAGNNIDNVPVIAMSPG